MRAYARNLGQCSILATFYEERAPNISPPPPPPPVIQSLFKIKVCIIFARGRHSIVERNIDLEYALNMDMQDCWYFTCWIIVVEM